MPRRARTRNASRALARPHAGRPRGRPARQRKARFKAIESSSRHLDEQGRLLLQSLCRDTMLHPRQSKLDAKLEGGLPDTGRRFHTGLHEDDDFLRKERMTTAFIHVT
eukprot:5545040-Pleurochrysis_carterae.AAC.1